MFPYGCISKRRFTLALSQQWIPGFDVPALADDPRLMRTSHLYNSGDTLQQLSELVSFLLTRPEEAVPIEVHQTPC
eukprot:1174002-Prorocentrum_minimum.AAC.2